MKITILTLFPEMFAGPFSHSIVKIAKEKNLVDIVVKDIREFGLGSHKTVDDTPYGGGNGMVLRVDVLYEAIANAREKTIDKNEERVILMSPQGETFKQKKAQVFSNLKHLIIICGHYEGVDARIDKFIDEKVSIGDFIVTGGEIPAMLITDSITRLIKGVLKDGVTESESFPLLLEHNQYTKPGEYKGLKVPEILMSGDHKKIEEYKMKESERITRELRPDLIQTSRSQALLKKARQE